MAATVHFAPAGTTRPACGAAASAASLTTTAAAVTCGSCRQTMSTVNFPTPHGRTNK